MFTFFAFELYKSSSYQQMLYLSPAAIIILHQLLLCGDGDNTTDHSKQPANSEDRASERFTGLGIGTSGTVGGQQR
jgi:hypothetical protein